MAGLGTQQKKECCCSSWKIQNCPLKFCGSNQGRTGLFSCADLLMKHGGKMDPNTRPNDLQICGREKKQKKKYF